MTLSRRYLADLGERAVRSFLQGFFGIWLVNPTEPIEFDTLFTVTNLKAGLVMAALAIGMAVVGKPIGNPDSGSVLPPKAQPPAPQPPEVPDPPAAGLTDVEQFADLLRRLQPIAAPPPPPPADVVLGGTPERLEQALERARANLARPT
jgi:hypothetical protein